MSHDSQRLVVSSTYAGKNPFHGPFCACAEANPQREKGRIRRVFVESSSKYFAPEGAGYFASGGPPGLGVQPQRALHRTSLDGETVRFLTRCDDGVMAR